ncbi:MAG: DUF2142 domain-containing protein [Lachnospiraceae bacterium]|nr:DUF2142 domain-containing protein [Lachnospiraceae bacterium]MBD5483145.1 DUF2142 domain-containing protein [Lachnospiraceae bacterium]
MRKKQHFRAMRIPAVIVAALVFSLLVELFFFNRKALFEKNYETSGRIEAGGTETILELEEECYIKTVRITASFEEAVDYRLIALDAQGGEAGEWTGVISPKLKESVYNLRTQAAGLVLILSDVPESDGVITAANFIEWSPYRILFFWVLFGLAAWLWLWRAFVAKKPEYAFAVIALTIGIHLILLTGTNQISYDEQTHVSKTWNLSYIGTVYDTEAVLELKTLRAPHFNNRWERELTESYLQGIHDYDTAEVYQQTKMIHYDRRAYLPMALFMAAGRTLKLPFAVMLMLSKLGNLLMYTVVCFFAVRTAKQAKGLVAVLALLPNSIFTASQFCYDACVNSFLLLGMVLTANEFFEPKTQVRPRNVAAILICLIIGSYAKPVYILMGCLLLFWGNGKFPSKRAAWLFRGALLILCLCMLYEILAKSATGGSAMATLANGGDTRMEGTNMLGQMKHIFGAPISYTGQLLHAMFGRIVDWFTGTDQFLMYAYLSTPGTLCTWIFFGAAAFAALVGCKEEQRSRLKTGYAALFAVMVFGMSAVVWTVLYMSFNAVGSPVIVGVQNRYFTPMLFPFFVCFLNGRLVWKWGKERYYQILFGIMAGLLLYCNWRLGIVPYYL